MNEICKISFKMFLFKSFSLILVLAIISSDVHGAVDRTRLRFKLSAHGLPDKDNIGTIDPYVEIFYTEFGSNSETKLARTDTITDNENPEWGTVFEFDFDRSKNQKWHFKIWDHDNGREDDKGGQTWVDVTDYVDKGEITNANLDKKGYLTVKSANPTQQIRGDVAPGQLPLPPGTPDTMQLRFKVSANGISSKDDVGFVQGASDPYVEIFAADGVTGKLRKIGRSGTLSGTINPSWGDIFTFPYDRRKDQRLQFKIWDNDNFREDDKAGLAWIEVNDYVSHGQAITVHLNKKGTLTVTRADGLPPNPYIPPSTFPHSQPTVPQPGFVHPPRGGAPVPAVVPSQINNFNQPQVQPVTSFPQPLKPVAPVTSFPQPSNPVAPLITIRFKLSANNLEDRDIIGTSDPYVKVYLTQDGRPEELLKTSAKLSDNENPTWPDIFEFKYDSTKNPRIRFLLLDEDDNRRDDELGNVTVDGGEIAQRNYISSSLTKGTLTITRV